MTCGTNAGHRAHFDPGGDRTPCDPCHKAHAEYRAGLRKRQYLNRGPVKVDGIGTRRRIRALMRMGWRGEDIAAVAVPHLKSGQRWTYAAMNANQVFIGTHEAIARAYEQLSHKRGPSQESAERALKKGWPPPMAWDDVDDPNCKPEGYLRPSEIRKIKNGKA